ncbi:hypothetical protein LCGC14_1506580 [marine sediment metagenome]|uniref:Uncharacterized protein n=1 Tax=marine sediment metagenome TaxID=412755 RepID=A0A0F9J2K6_9ZZZZ
MAAENFDTFVETDPGSVIEVTSSRVTWTDIEARQDNTHVSLDKGAAFFDGSFVHTLTISLIASEKGASYSFFWSMTNDLDDFQGLLDNSKDALVLRCVHPNSPDIPVIQIFELDSGSPSGSATKFNLTTGVVYYLTLTRNETIGSFGDLILTIYSDAARTTLLSTLTLNLNVKTDFRYVMVGQSFDATGGGGADLKKQTGYSEDLDIMGVTQGSTPQVSTQLPTLIAAATAVGNGTIADLGISAVTAHGWVWDTSPIDTAVAPGSQPNSTDGGAGSVGPFVTPITGLTGGLIYFARAYATNALGTTYGEGVQWKAGASYSTKEWGDTSMKGNELHTVGEDGVERAHMGTPV